MCMLVYSIGTKATHRKTAVNYAAHSLSRGSLKNLLPRSFTFVCQLYCCISKHNNNKALRITFNSLSTSSMALATVNITACTGSTSCCISHGPSQWEREISTLHSSETHRPIFMKLEIYNYFPDTTQHAKFQGPTSTWVVWANSQFDA